MIWFQKPQFLMSPVKIRVTLPILSNNVVCICCNIRVWASNPSSVVVNTYIVAFVYYTHANTVKQVCIISYCFCSSKTRESKLRRISFVGLLKQTPYLHPLSLRIICVSFGGSTRAGDECNLDIWWPSLLRFKNGAASVAKVSYQTYFIFVFFNWLIMASILRSLYLWKFILIFVSIWRTIRFPENDLMLFRNSDVLI